MAVTHVINLHPLPFSVIVLAIFHLMPADLPASALLLITTSPTLLSPFLLSSVCAGDLVIWTLLTAPLSSGLWFDLADRRHHLGTGESGVLEERKLGVFTFLPHLYFTVAIWIVVGSIYMEFLRASSPWFQLSPDHGNIISSRCPLSQVVVTTLLLFILSAPHH